MNQSSPRSRNAAATREAILASAVAGFTRHGYDGIGVRDIAKDAGVTAMLVNRYFGSKEGLFTEVVDVVFAPPTMVPGDPGPATGLARSTAEALVGRTDPAAGQLGPFDLMLRSAANPRAAEIIRAGIEQHVGARFAAALDGPHASERAELGLSLLAGVWLLRTVIGTPALRETPAARLTEQVAAMLSVVVDPRPSPR
ncbi:TetR family transcriptional regulator [Kribbella amoyensis]|uniref:TetR family transcriptional regulator n=1 Tax=Kribbella amoyensis TaxID=996641 RepID=A0A561BTT1_9ACTN|nr:TetR/AcrR family transcriptional regulator [Kribbella amoyensis]TWD82212.1 TetR family transcriptional regulator [Kribbella amoyensis]